MYAAGAREYFDILSANAFGLGSSPHDPPNPGKLNFQRVLLERQVMEEFGDADKPIWVLEYGWNAAPDWMPDSRLVWGRVSDEQQAQYTVEGIEHARKNWQWAGVFSIWFFRQVGDIQPSNPEYYFRMVDVDFAPRPVYFSVGRAAAQLQVAAPGKYEETNPALAVEGSWVLERDQYVSGGESLSTQDEDARARLRFYGRSVDLVVRRRPNGGKLFARLDGQPIGGLTRDEAGQSYIDLAADTDQSQVVLPVVRDAPPAEHILELDAEGHVNLDGFVVHDIPPNEPPWLWIGGLTGLGVAALTLGVRRARAGATLDQAPS
jgi:hypothetical protein